MSSDTVTPPPDPHGKTTDVTGPARQLIDRAIREIPAARYFLGVVGIAAALSLTGALLLYNWKVAFVGGIVVFFGAVLVVVFANLARLGPGWLKLPAIVLTWMSIILIGATAICLFTSVFFGVPLNLKRWFDDVTSTNKLKMTPIHDTVARIPEGTQVFMPSPRVEGLDGTWVSTGDPDPQMNGRFRLEISKDSCRWTEVGRIRGELVKLETSGLIKHTGDEIRIERPNDAKVLAFLFRPVVADQVLRRNPPPSFLLIRQEGKRLIGTWNGLVARTYGTDKVQEIGTIAQKCEFIKDEPGG